MAKKKFQVECTIIYNGIAEVGAESKEEALEIVGNSLNCTEIDDFPDKGNFGLAHFKWGEATADYANEIINN